MSKTSSMGNQEIEESVNQQGIDEMVQGGYRVPS
jgi:hypothetical protein